MKFLTGMLLGNVRSLCRILWNVLFLFFPRKGVRPYNISYKRIPISWGRRMWQPQRQYQTGMLYKISWTRNSHLGILDIDLFTSTFVLWYHIDYKHQAKLKLAYIFIYIMCPKVVLWCHTGCHPRLFHLRLILTI